MREHSDNYFDCFAEDEIMRKRSIMQVEANEIHSRIRVDKILSFLKLIEVIPQEYTNPKLTCSDVCNKFSDVLSELPYKASMVIHLRHLSPQRVTLENIGFLLGVTCERIRQIEAKAIRILKARIKRRKIYEILRLEK